MSMSPDTGKEGHSTSSFQVAQPSSLDRTISLDAPLSLCVDFDQVEETARLFEDNVNRLTDLIGKGEHDLQMRPLADDEVSEEGAAGFTAAGQVYRDAVTGYRDWLRTIAIDLRSSAAKYRSSDGGSAGNLRGVAGG